jgi:hypothetical protein
MHSIKTVNSALFFLNRRHNYVGILKDVVMLEKMMLCFYELKSLFLRILRNVQVKRFVLIFLK